MSRPRNLEATMRMAMGLLFFLVVIAAPLVGVYLAGAAFAAAGLEAKLSSLVGVIVAEAVVFAGVFVLARRGR